MSADNQTILAEWRNGYGIWNNQSASDEDWRPLRDPDAYLPDCSTHAEAIELALRMNHDEYHEYGVVDLMEDDL